LTGQSLAFAQDPARIALPPARDMRSLRVEKVGELRTVSGAALPMPSSLLRVQDGSIWYGSYDPVAPLHFDRFGRVIGKLVAPSWIETFGAGMLIALGQNDSLLFYEPNLQRLIVVDPTGRVIRAAEVTVEHGVSVAWSTRGNIAISGSISTREKAGFPLHFLSSTGVVFRSVSPGTPMSLGYVALQAELIARAAAGGFWSVDQDRHVIRHWDSQGQIIGELRNRPSWFSDRTPYPTVVSMSEPPLPQVVAMRERRNGHLLVLSLVAGRHWKSGLQQRVGRFGKRVATVEDFDKYVDTMIEDIDSTTGRATASRRLDGFFPYIVDDSEIAHVVPSPHSSSAVVEIWRLQDLVDPYRRKKK
jgi:hypothetical protein